MKVTALEKLHVSCVQKHSCSGYEPFLFNESSTQSLVAPFFSGVDILNGIGETNY